jgi:hypothetical protein
MPARSLPVVGPRRAADVHVAVSLRSASTARATRSRTPTKLYSYETLLERLAQDLENMAAALGPFIQEEHPVVREGHLARHRHLTPADPPRVSDGLVGGAPR